MYSSVFTDPDVDNHLFFPYSLISYLSGRLYVSQSLRFVIQAHIFFQEIESVNLSDSLPSSTSTYRPDRTQLGVSRNIDLDNIYE